MATAIKLANIECRACGMVRHGAAERPWIRFGSQRALDRVNSLVGRPPIFRLDTVDCMDEVGGPYDSFWIAQDGVILFKRAPLQLTQLDEAIILHGGCEVPKEKLEAARFGNQFYTNEEWYYTHILHGCIRQNCPYMLINYHPDPNNTTFPLLPVASMSALAIKIPFKKPFEILKE